MSSPHPVSDHLTSWIRSRARSQGLIVWPDADGHYTDFVERLARAYTEGAFDIPVVPFRQSFLEQMRALQPHTGGLRKWASGAKQQRSARLLLQPRLRGSLESERLASTGS